MWVPERGQWLLSTVISNDKGCIVLRFDARYGIMRGRDERMADAQTVLENTHLFRFIGLRAIDEVPGDTQYSR